MDIINATCAEIQTPVGFLYVILPAILNHTNNPDCDQSWYLQLKHETVFRGVFRASFSTVIQKTGSQADTVMARLSRTWSPALASRLWGSVMRLHGLSHRLAQQHPH
ncbi:hypothetical protein ROHU_014655 [Labeo rohita]|uniref:Uncharacterized protein n=1 Tax=Labeo rohita TaxID=84645 RepID=A0A498NTR1_LABRO|nr:hypothetical protein ROHU_014655 [Labeo rohita]